MKLSTVVLTLSLAANLALAAVWFARRSAPTSAAAVPAGATKASLVRAEAAPTAPQLGSEFFALTPTELRDRLRDSGLPPNIVAHLLAARIFAPVRARENELMAEALKTTPPWRMPAMKNDRFAILTPAQRKELRDLEADARNETLRLLGPAYMDPDGTIAFKYAYVSAEKAVMLDALDRDYANLATQWKEETRYLKTPADREREKFLRDEQDRDLAALLTPAERDAYEQRSSPTAQNASFQSRMAAFKPTEAEYRALFALQKAEDERRLAQTDSRGLPTGRPAQRAPTGTTMAMMSGAPELPETDVRAALGDARMAEWQLAGTPYYQSLARVVANNQLPPQAIPSVAAILNATLDTSWKIADNATLDVTQKKAALAELANNTRSQVATHLGPHTQSYLTSTRWFDGIATGTAAQVRGSTTYFRAVDRPPPTLPPGGAPRVAPLPPKG